MRRGGRGGDGRGGVVMLVANYLVIGNKTEEYGNVNGYKHFCVRFLHELVSQC